MAGTAELNVVVNLISKVGKNIGPLKRDAAEVSKLLEDLLSSPVADQGKGFLALFNIKESDSPKKVIENITKVVEELSAALRSGEGQTILDKLGGGDIKKAEEALRGLGAAAKTVLIQQLETQGTLVKSTEDAVDKETKARERGAQSATKIAQNAAAQQLAIEREVTNGRVAEIQKQIREYQQLIAAAQQKIEGLPKGASASKGELREDIKVYRQAIKELTKELETFGVKSVEVEKGAARARAKATEEGLRAEVQAVETAVKQEASIRAESERAVQATTGKDTRIKDALVVAENILTIERQLGEEIATVYRQLATVLENLAKARVTAAQQSANAIALEEAATAQKIAKSWEQVQTALNQTTPRGSTREVTIKFYGEGSSRLPITEKISEIRQKFDGLINQVNQSQVTISTATTTEEIAKTTAGVKQLDQQLAQAVIDAQKFSNELALSPDLSRQEKLKLQFDVSDAITSAQKAQQEIVKIVEQGASKAAAIDQQRVEAEKRAAEQRAEAERKVLDSIKITLSEEEKASAKAELAKAQAAKAGLTERMKAIAEETNARVRFFNSDSGRLKAATDATGKWAAAQRAAFAETRKQLETMKGQLAELSKTEKYYLDFVARIEASPVQPFSQGLADIQKRLAGLSLTKTLLLKFENFEATLTKLRTVEAELERLAVREQELLTAGAQAKTPGQQVAIQKQTAEVEAGIEQQKKLYGQLVQTAEKSYGQIAEMAGQAESKKLAEVNRAYDLSLKERQAARAKQSEIAQSWEEREAAQTKLVAEQTAAMWAQHEKEVTAEKRAGEKAREKLVQEEAQFEKATARETTAALRLSAQEQKNTIVESLQQARTAAAAAAGKVQDALAAGSKSGAKEAASSYDAIRRQIDSLVKANATAADAVRRADRGMADAAAKDAAEAVERIKKELGTLGLSWENVQKPGLDAARAWEDRMNSLSYRFTHVGFQLGIFGAAALEAFKKPIEAAKELAKTVEYTSAILGGSIETVEKLRKAALELGSSTIYSSQQVAEGMRALAQAGLTAEESIRGVVPILDFASAGMIDLEHASRIAISTMYQFKLGLKDLPAITQNIQAAANRTNAEVKDFGEALKNVGPTAKAVGASLEDTTAALGVLSQAGINASRAGTQMRGVYRRLLQSANASSKVGRIFKELGISVVDAAGNFKNFADILDEFKKQTADMTEVQRAGKVYEIFGRLAGGPAMIAFLNAGREAIDKLKVSMAESADQAEIARDRGEGLFGALEKLKNAFTALVQQIGYAEGSFLKGLIDGLASFLGYVREAIEASPLLQKMISGFLTLAAISGSIALLGSAFALMFGNMLSVLGVVGPLKRIFDSLVLTMRGIPPEIAKKIVLEEADTAAMGKNAAAARALGVTNQGLAASFRSLNFAMKAFIGIAIVTTLYEVGKAIYYGAKAVAAANEQISEGQARAERFKAALAKPIANKEQFSLMTEAEKRAEIKRLSEAKQAVYGTIQDIENRIAKKKTFTFGLGSTKDLQKELADAQKKLAELEKQDHITLHPDIDLSGAGEKAKREATQIVTDLDLLFGNKKLGINKFDISKVLKALEKAEGGFAKFQRAAERSTGGLQRGVDDTAKLTAELGNAFDRLGIDISTAQARELQDTRNLNQEKLNVVTEYYAAAMQATQDYLDEVDSDEKTLTQDRQNAYEETLAALDTMYEDAVSKMDKYAEDVLKAEENLAKERVDAYNWYIEQTEIADKIKSQKTKLRENEEARGRLQTLYAEQVAAGDYDRAKKTLDQIGKLAEEANKKRASDVADALEGEKKSREEIAELEEKIRRKAEERLDATSVKIAKNAEQERRALRAVTEAEERLNDLRERRKFAKTDQQRLSINQQIETQERRIAELRERASQFSDKEADLKKKGAEAAESERSLKQKLEVEQAKLTTYQNILATNSDIVQRSREEFEQKQQEEKLGQSRLDILLREKKLQEDNKWIYEERIALATRMRDKSQANLAIWQEQANEARVVRALLVAINESLGRLSVAKTASDELKKLQARLKDEQIEIKITADAKDSRTVQIFDLATGKAIREVKIPVTADADQAKIITEIIQGLTHLEEGGPVQAFAQADPSVTKTLTELNRVGTTETKLKVDTSDVRPALTQAQLEAARAKLIVKFSSEMDAKTSETYRELMALKRSGIVLPFKVQGSDELQKVTISAQELADLKKYYGDQGINFTIKINDEGFATLPTNFGAVLVSMRADAETLGREIGTTLATQTTQAAAAATPIPEQNPIVTAAEQTGVEAGTAAGRGFGKGFSGTWEEQKSLMERWGTALGEIIGQIVRAIGSAIVTLVKALAEKETWIALGQTIKLIIVEVFKGVGLAAYYAFIAPFKGLGNFLKGLAKGVYNGVTGGDTPGGRWGGFVRGMARGGHLPGYGGGDRRLTLLEDGEYVLPKEAVRGIGLDALNNLRALFTRGLGLPNFSMGIPRMAVGGAVGANSSGPLSLGSYDLNLNIGGQRFPVTGRKDVVEALLETVRRERMTSR